MRQARAQLHALQRRHHIVEVALQLVLAQLAHLDRDGHGVEPVSSTHLDVYKRQGYVPSSFMRKRWGT